MLRVFLGITFVYAGLQKLSDPGYLHRGSATFIGTQLHAFSLGTPAGPLLRVLALAPVPVGIAIAIAETAIGVATLTGTWPLAAAAGGLAVNAILALSATWHVHPYFLGSDSVYAVAWLALFLSLIQLPPPLRATVPYEDRREFLRAVGVGGASLAMAAVAWWLRAPGAPAVTLGESAPEARTDAPAASPPTREAPSAPPATGRTIAHLSDVQVGAPVGFDDPAVGPAVLLRLPGDRVVAYSRICTHAGCLVGYDGSAGLLACPCHGAEFDPARGAQPVAGPAPSPLATIAVSVDPATGAIALG